MNSTIKLLETQLTLLYISFVFLIIEIVGMPIYAIVMASMTNNGAMLLIAITDIIPIILAVIIKTLIECTKGSISEHNILAARVKTLEADVSSLKNKVKQNNPPMARVVKETVVENEKQENVALAPAETEKEIEEIVNVNPTDVEIGENIITINGKIHSIKKVSNLASLGNRLTFVIDETKYVVKFDYYHESSKMYSDIYFRL